MNPLLRILETIDGLLSVADQLPVVGATAEIAQAFERIAAKTLQQHQAIVGTPLDLSKLHDIKPL